MKALTARGIKKDFPSGAGTTQILRGVDFDADLGKLTFLIGPSGSGKTTLLSILSGILEASEGEVVVLGETITKLRGRKKALFRRARLGFVFQQFNLLPALTAAENAAVPLISAGMDNREAVTRAKDLLSRLDMSAHVDKQPRQLSGGQQQRVAIARALIHDPGLIVCDEPTASLDAQTGRAVLDILREIAHDPRRAVLVVTHDNRIFHFADRIVAMNDGLIEGERPVPAAPELHHV